MMRTFCPLSIWKVKFFFNHINLERTPGGSTGGEACLIAAGGSPFGNLPFRLKNSATWMS